MVYEVRIQQSIDEMEMRQMQGSAIDYENYTHDKMFDQIAHEMKKNLSGEIQVHEDTMRQVREKELKIIVHGYREYSKKIHELKKLIQINSIPVQVQRDILHLFRDDEVQHKPLKEKTYI